MSTIRVALADDNVLLREGVSRLVSAHPDFELVGTASDLPELLALIESAEPDVVSSDCPLAGLQLKQKTGRPVYHPVRILRAAYLGVPLRSPKGGRGGDLPAAKET